MLDDGGRGIKIATLLSEESFVKAWSALAGQGIVWRIVDDIVACGRGARS